VQANLTKRLKNLAFEKLGGSNFLEIFFRDTILKAYYMEKHSENCISRYKLDKMK
jgi:hypothetical protein